MSKEGPPCGAKSRWPAPSCSPSSCGWLFRRWPSGVSLVSGTRWAGLAAVSLLTAFSPIVVERADPIISPGRVSGHVHTIMGGNGFGFNMTYADTQKSTCSSCMVTQDFSNYWVPKLYYMAQNGTFVDVGQVGGVTVYYL